MCHDHSARFNSRTLGRVRLSCNSCQIEPSVWFQFTHPGKGATKEGVFLDLCKLVSIHAPWEGCDCRSGQDSRRYSCFNSRTLGRVRLSHSCRTPHSLMFQFTHPGKGATIFCSIYSASCGKFQFTHPGKGATVWCKVAYYRADKQA